MKTARQPTPHDPQPAVETPPQNVPFHVHLARIRELERAQKSPGRPTPVRSQPTPRSTAALMRAAGQERFVALRKRAAELESAKLFEQALPVYMELVNSLDHCPEDLEIALLNRVGDLLTKVGKGGQAGDYYEMAADKYAARGLTDNAIAVFGKILRSTPERTAIYHKLGKLCGTKGLRDDARRNYIEYASRSKLARNYEEAFRALGEFIELFPDQDDVRLSLIDQLEQAGYHHETVTQLEALAKYYRSAGRLDEARQIANRLEGSAPKFSG